MPRSRSSAARRATPRCFMSPPAPCAKTKSGASARCARSRIIALMSSSWPSLPYDAWKDTHTTLHLWTQIVGKIPLARSPWLNHSWHVTYFVTARRLATRLIPHDTESLQIEFDFVQHRLWVRTTGGGTSSVPLVAQSVAAFYRQFMAALGELGVPVA